MNVNHLLIIIFLQINKVFRFNYKTKIQQMPRKISNQQIMDKSDSQTQSLDESQIDQLEKILDSNTSRRLSFKTPNKNKIQKKKQILSNLDQTQQDWRTQFTKTIYNPLQNVSGNMLVKQLIKKYPKQIQNTKLRTLTVKVHGKCSIKYECLCSICLDIHANISGILQCGHKFCYQCIFQWAKSSTNCPCCRRNFNHIVQIISNTSNNQIHRQIIQIQQKIMEYNQGDYFICYQCNRGDDQEVLLICDICDFYCCHVYCDSSLSNVFPTDDWYCRNCKTTLTTQPNQAVQSEMQRTAQISEITRNISGTKTLTNIVESQQQDIEDEISVNNFSGQKQNYRLRVQENTQSDCQNNKYNRTNRLDYFMFSIHAIRAARRNRR